MSTNILSDVVRTCIQSSFQEFETIPKEVGDNFLNDDYRTFIVRESERFREHLRTLNEDINAIAESMDSMESTANNGAQLDAEYDLIYSLEQSWHICEVVLLNPTKHISIDLAKWLRTSIRQFPLTLAIEQMKLDEQPELLKKSNLDANTIDYWESIYSMIMQGSGLLACEALALHSEISQVLLLSQQERTDLGGYTRSTIEKSHCQALFELILTHPYAALISGEEIQTPAVDNTGNHFRDWQAKVKKFRHSHNAILMRIPQLDTILRLLLGEMEALGDVAGNDWMLMTLSMLLYVYPPPLTRINLCQIVTEASEFLESLHTSQAFTLLDVKLNQTVRDVLTGNVGPLLKSLHESGSQYLSTSTLSGSSVNPVVETVAYSISTVSLLSLSHLSVLLVHGADKRELNTKIKKSSGKTSVLGTDFEYEEASFVEQLFLESCQRLNCMEYPIVILLGYLDTCIDHGLEYARCLLNRRPLHTDEIAMEIAAALHSLGHTKDADAVVMSRAQFWLRKSHRVYQSVAFVKSIVVPHRDVVSNCLDTEPYPLTSLALAIQFLQKLNDSEYMDSLVDRSLYQCMSAVASCAPLFTGLTVFPMAPVPNNSPMFVYQPSVPETKEVRVFTKDEESQLISHLESVLQEASEVLDIVDVEGYVPTSTMQLLSAYLSVIRARLYESESLSALYNAAVTVNEILNNEQLQVPYRYYLHLLDLSLWFSGAIAELKRIQLYSPRTVDTSVSSSESGNDFNNYVFTKADAYRLLTGFTKITTSWASERFVAGSGANASDMQSLRLSLLGQVANSVVQDNANHYVNRMALSKVNGGSGVPGSGMMKGDVFLRNRVPAAVNKNETFGRGLSKTTGIGSKLSLTGLKNNVDSSFGFSRNIYFRAAGYPTDPEKANEIRKQMKSFEALTASVHKFLK